LELNKKKFNSRAAYGSITVDDPVGDEFSLYDRNNLGGGIAEAVNIYD
jgi:hypothetical protein